MASEVSKMIQMICEEKGLEYSIVMEAVESALAAAYRKDFGNRQQNIKLKFDPETGDMQAWDVKEVTQDYTEEELEKAQEELAARGEKAETEGRELSEEEVADLIHFNTKMHIMQAAAQEVKKDAKIGDVLEIDLPIPGDFGRMAAQTAKQVIIQKLREAERSVVFADFKEQEGRIVQGIVQRRDRSGSVIVDFGKITGIVPSPEQIPRGNYRPGVRLPFLVTSVEMGARGPEILLSRAAKRLVHIIFEQEIPEVEAGSVEVKAIARDAGNRAKVAVWTGDDSIDPIGACIGQRGSRITTIIEGLGGEKIDVIQFSEDAAEYIKHALSPAKVTAVSLGEGGKEARAHVAEDQFSLAIGRGGQNVRLAGELTGWNISVVQEEGEKKGEEATKVQSDEGTKETEKPSPAEVSAVTEVMADKSAGTQEISVQEAETKAEEESGEAKTDETKSEQ